MPPADFSKLQGFLMKVRYTFPPSDKSPEEIRKIFTNEGVPTKHVNVISGRSTRSGIVKSTEVKAQIKFPDPFKKVEAKIKEIFPNKDVIMQNDTPYTKMLPIGELNINSPDAVPSPSPPPPPPPMLSRAHTRRNRDRSRSRTRDRSRSRTRDRSRSRNRYRSRSRNRVHHNNNLNALTTGFGKFGFSKKRQTRRSKNN